jgi:hypothetical protein
MTLNQRTHLARQDEDFNETGVQIRDNDPSSPLEGQTWLNTSENVIKNFAGGVTRVLTEKGLGASLQIPVSGIVDCAIRRSYFREINANYTINNFTNFVDGLLLYLRIRNLNNNVVQRQTVTLPDPATTPAGSYWFVDNNGNAQFFVWTNLNGNSVAPVVPGRIAIPVVINGGLPSTDEIRIGKLVTDPGASPSDTTTINVNIPARHFLINSANDAQQFYVWYNVDLAGFDPLVVGRTGIQVFINSTDTQAQVAQKTRDALNAVAGSPFTATSSGRNVSVTRNANGPVTASSDVSVNTDVFDATFAVTTTQGNLAQTAANFATATAAALASNGFPTESVVGANATFNGASAGVVPIATNFNMPSPFNLAVNLLGAGAVTVTFPPEVLLEAGDEVINGGKQKVYTLLRSGANIFITSATYDN